MARFQQRLQQKLQQQVQQFQQKLQQRVQQFEQQMEQQSSAALASLEPVIPPRGNLARFERDPSGVMQVDGGKLELPGNTQTTTAAPEPLGNVQVPEGSRNTRYSSRLTRAPLSDGILFDVQRKRKLRLFKLRQLAKPIVEEQIAVADSVIDWTTSHWQCSVPTGHAVIYFRALSLSDSR
ncbi:unnamed protein product [Clonostachys rosea f. rosea IK726]|uniref:Uncharacterized protein n=1 Tax=Clonostachys rosea f. rosea IK726 TaxID=1349383 RepID=A0ACA9UGC5_BIOOC|nr:unnamed protein product [Clonostachys rosea f. rosea IK726]